MSPRYTPERRERTMHMVATDLTSDDRIEGVLLVGSLARSPDPWSDIDLAVCIEEDFEARAVAADWTRRLIDDLSALHHFETSFGTTLVVGFLLEDLLEVDVAFTPRADFEVWGPARVLFDRSGRLAEIVATPTTPPPEAPDWRGGAGIAWHDIIHAYVATRRGRGWQALWYLERVRNRALALASERRGWYAGFFDYVDDLPTEELAPFHASLARSLDPAALLGATEAAARGFFAVLRQGDADLCDRLEGPVLSLFSDDS